MSMFDIIPAAKRRAIENSVGMPIYNDEFGGDGDDDGDDSSEDVGPRYVQVGLPSRQEENEEFAGIAKGHRSKCFACICSGGKKMAHVPLGRLDALLKKFVKCVGQMDECALVKQTSQEYKKIRREVNARLLPGQTPLPRWSEPMILEHFRYHHADPTFHIWLRTKQLRELNDIALQAAVELDTKTNKPRINKDQHKCFLDGIKAEQQLMKMKDTDCMFFNEGKQLDKKGMSQGPVALGFRPIADMLRRGNKRK